MGGTGGKGGVALVVDLVNLECYYCNNNDFN